MDGFPGVGTRFVFSTGQGVSFDITVTAMDGDRLTGAIVHKVIPDEHVIIAGPVKLPAGWVYADE